MMWYLWLLNSNLEFLPCLILLNFASESREKERKTKRKEENILRLNHKKSEIFMITTMQGRVNILKLL